MNPSPDSSSSAMALDGDVIQAPSLENCSPTDWQQHAEIAYLFARAVGHDMVNIHTSMEMLEHVRQMPQPDVPDAELPEQLGAQQIRRQLSQNVVQLIGLSQNLALLNQSANAVAYEPVRSVDVAELIEEAVISRLGDAPVPVALPAEPDGAKVVVFGEMLSAAVTCFYFQWSPHMHEHAAASRAAAQIEDDRITLSFAADDGDSVEAFANHLHSEQHGAIQAVARQSLATRTGELALWLARFVVLIHGGDVDVDPGDPDLTLRLTLPLIR